jgi:hypothetical protein
MIPRLSNHAQKYCALNCTLTSEDVSQNKAEDRLGVNFVRKALGRTYWYCYEDARIRDVT